MDHRWVEMGEVTMPPPTAWAPGRWNGFVPETRTGLKLDGPARIRVRVSGALTGVQNPAHYALCAADFAWLEPEYIVYYCKRAPIGPIGPLGFLFGSNLSSHVLAHWAPDTPGYGNRLPVWLEEVPGEPYTAEAVLDVPAGELVAERTGVQCYYMSGNTSTPCYIFSGDVKITLEVLEGHNTPPEPPTEVAELKCNGAPNSVRITRADELTCKVSGATDITGWEFRADSSGYQNPAAGGTPFRGIEWKGRVVLSGTVTVNVRVGGAVESKSVRVSVEARDWGGMTMPRTVSEEDPALHLSPRPDSVQQLGDIHHSMAVEFQGMDKWAPIFSGPNANLAYLVEPPAEYVGTVHVNRAALSRDSDFWKAQYTRQRSSGVVDCLQRQEDITGFIPVILRHEGIGLDPKSHAYLYVTTADRVGNPRYERVVGSTLQELADQATAVLTMAHDSAKVASDLADSPGYAPPWCRFHFNYGGR